MFVYFCMWVKVYVVQLGVHMTCYVVPWIYMHVQQVGSLHSQKCTAFTSVFIPLVVISETQSFFGGENRKRKPIRTSRGMLG